MVSPLYINPCYRHNYCSFKPHCLPLTILLQFLNTTMFYPPPPQIFLLLSLSPHYLPLIFLLMPLFISVHLTAITAPCYCMISQWHDLSTATAVTAPSDTRLLLLIDPSTWMSATLKWCLFQTQMQKSYISPIKWYTAIFHHPALINKYRTICHLYWSQRHTEISPNVMHNFRLIVYRWS